VLFKISLEHKVTVYTVEKSYKIFIIYCIIHTFIRILCFT